MFWIVAKLLAETANQHVDGPIEGFPIDPASLVDDSVAAQHPASISHEQSQDLKFGIGESEITSPHLSRAYCPIQIEIANPNSLPVVAALPPPQDRLYAGQKFTRFEWFWQVVVRA